MMGWLTGFVVRDHPGWPSAIPWICGAVAMVLALQFGYTPLLFAVACALAPLISWLVARSS